MKAAALTNFEDSEEQAPEDARHVELLERVRAGDTGAFETLYKLYYARLFRFLHRVTQQAELAEEAFNETMLVVWEKPDGFDRSSKVSTWIFGIGYRKALKARAKWGPSVAHAPLEDMADFLPDRTPTGVDRFVLENALSHALAALPQEQRAVVELTAFHGLAYQEIAQILDCPENTVKTRMFHARKKLQPLLRELTSVRHEYHFEENRHEDNWT